MRPFLLAEGAGASVQPVTRLDGESNVRTGPGGVKPRSCFVFALQQKFSRTRWGGLRGVAPSLRACCSTVRTSPDVCSAEGAVSRDRPLRAAGWKSAPVALRSRTADGRRRSSGIGLTVAGRQRGRPRESFSRSLRPLGASTLRCPPLSRLLSKGTRPPNRSPASGPWPRRTRVSPKALLGFSLSGASSEAASSFPCGPEEEVNAMYDHVHLAVKLTAWIVFACQWKFSREVFAPSPEASRRPTSVPDAVESSGVFGGRDRRFTQIRD